MINQNAQLFNRLFANRERRKVITGKVAISTGVVGNDPRVYTTSTGAYVDGTGKSTGDALLPNRIWVHDLNKTKNEVVYNKQVQYVSNMTVEMELTDGGYWEVLGADVVEGTETFGSALSTVASPEQLSEVNASTISARQFKPLRGRISQNGGLNMYVEPGWIHGQYWQGGEIDLTSAQSGIGSSKKAWVVISYDTVSRALNATAGSDNELFATMLVADIESIAIDSDNEPVAATVLNDTQTTIDASKIVDLRNFVYSSPLSVLDRIVVDATGSIIVDATGKIVIGA